MSKGTQVRQFVKDHRRGLLIAGIVAVVASGRFEFIPWTVASALELIGVSAVAIGAADTVDAALTKKNNESVEKQN